MEEQDRADNNGKWKLRTGKGREGQGRAGKDRKGHGSTGKSTKQQKREVKVS